MQQLRFDREEIVWQEVPGEVSLAFLCSGCPLRCQGCHSSGSWKAGRGAVLSEDYLRSRLQQYRGLISCVLFMGGEWHCALLEGMLRIAREEGLHTCLYTGLERNELLLRAGAARLHCGVTGRAATPVRIQFPWHEFCFILGHS